MTDLQFFAFFVLPVLIVVGAGVVLLLERRSWKTLQPAKPIMQRLHDREINSSISSMFDGAWTVKIGGSDMAGWKAQELVASFEEAEAWLEAKAREMYPESH